MSGGSPFNEKYVEQCFERQRAMLALTFEQNLNELLLMQKTFMENMFGYMKSTVAAPPVAAAAAPPELEAVDEESSSIRIVDDIEEESSSVDSSSFVEPSDSEPQVYPAKVIDEWYQDKNLPEKRNRKKRTMWSPNDHDGEKADEGEELGQDVPSRYDVIKFKQFITDAKKNGVEFALLNVWYQKTWGRQLDGIRDNLGRDGKNKECKELFDTVIVSAFKSNTLTVLPSGHDGYDICSLCNMKKRCTQQVCGHLLAICCAQLVKAMIEFFEYLWGCVNKQPVDWTAAFIAARDKFGNILTAHGEKGNKKRWRKAI